MSAPDALSTDQFGLKVRPDYFPARLGEYTPVGTETVDARTLTATQATLHSKPSMAKAARSRTLPQVYDDPDIGERVIGDGHHRAAAHARAGKPLKVTVYRRNP